MTSTLNQYLQELKKPKYEPLENLLETAKDFKYKGDMVAKGRLIDSHLRAVVGIAKKYSLYSEQLMELIQAGNVGLIEAIDKFDPSRGLTLMTYANLLIKNRIFDHIYNNFRAMNCPSSKKYKKLFNNLRKYTDVNNGLSLADKEKLAEKLKVSLEDIDLMYEFLYINDFAIASDNYEENDTSVLSIDDLDNSTEKVYIAETTAMERSQAIHNAVNNLPDREKDIINRRWFKENADTLSTIAKDYNVSLQAINLSEKSAKKKLRQTTFNNEGETA